MADFIGTIADMRDGKVATQLSTFLTELVARVAQTEQPGELTLKLKVIPMTTENGVAQIEIRPVAATKMPQPALGTSLLYATQEGDVSRTDPNQLQMFEAEERTTKR